MKKSLWAGLLICVVMLVGGCAPIQPAASAPAGETGGNLTVLAAASLQEAFEAIGADFKAAHPGSDVAFSFAGSQVLAQQIDAGAPADVFASADTKQMDAAVTSGRIDADAPQIFARNRLVIVVPAANPAGVETLADLANPGVKVVLADETVPVGRYSRQFLAKASETPELTETYSPTVISNVVSFDDNVRSVLNRVALGEADAGIVYQTDVKAAGEGSVTTIEIPDELNVIATYPIAALNDSKLGDLSRAFVDYVLSEAGQETLGSFGFQAPK